MKSQHFFYVGLGALLLALLVACGQVPFAEPETGQQPAPIAEVVAPQTEEQPLSGEAEATTGSAFYAANPELMMAGRYPASVEEKPVTGSAYYAANPELLKVHPPVIGEEISESTFLANNPELMATRRYVTLVEARNGSAFYAANPELIVANRYPASIEGKPVTDSAYYAANPELLKAHPPTLVEAMSESTFLANNPELMVAGRYAIAIEDKVSQPESYDIEILRIQRYAEAAEKRAEAAFLAANPELLKAHPPVVAKEMSESTFLANNPELGMARRRLATVIEESVDSTFLAANPELMVAHRYATIVDLRGEGD